MTQLTGRELAEGKATYGTWFSAVSFPMLALIECAEFRVKPKETPVHTVNGFTVPAPLREPLRTNTIYYYPSLGSPSFFYQSSRWCDQGYDTLKLARGLVFATADHASANAKAMMKIDPEWEE